MVLPAFYVDNFFSLKRTNENQKSSSSHFTSSPYFQVLLPHRRTSASSSRSRRGWSSPSPRNHQNIFLFHIVLCNSSPLHTVVCGGRQHMIPKTSPTRSPTEPHISEAQRNLQYTSTYLQPSIVWKLYLVSSSISSLLLPSFPSHLHLWSRRVLSNFLFCNLDPCIFVFFSIWHKIFKCASLFNFNPNF